MKAYKVKTKKSEADKITAFEGQAKVGSVRVQAVFYSSHSPAHELMLYDKDGDCFTFPIPGQVTRKVITFEHPVTVALPLYYVDPEGENEIIVFGETE